MFQVLLFLVTQSLYTLCLEMEAYFVAPGQVVDVCKQKFRVTFKLTGTRIWATLRLIAARILTMLLGY